MGSIIFFVLCVIISISIQPISNKIGLTEYLINCSNTKFYVISYSCVFVVLFIVKMMFIATIKLN